VKQTWFVVFCLGSEFELYIRRYLQMVSRQSTEKLDKKSLSCSYLLKNKSITKIHLF